MATSKHVRKTGATTVTKNGKIVGNIGAGKTNVPTAQNDNVSETHHMAEDTTVSHITTVQHKFNKLAEDDMTLGQAQTLWNLTKGKNIVERLNILANYVDSLNENDQKMLVKQIENEDRNTAINQSISLVLTGDMCGRVNPKILDVLARRGKGNWNIAISENKDTSPETLDFLANSIEHFQLFNVANHQHASPATLHKLANYHSNDPAITEAAQTIIRQTAKENQNYMKPSNDSSGVS